MRRREPRLAPFAVLLWSFGASRLEFATLAAALLCVWACELAIPFLLGETVDAAVSRGGGMSAILERGGMVAALTIVLYVFHAAYLRGETRVIARATFALRKLLYGRILDQPLGFFGKSKSAEISHRIMIDSDVIDRHGIYLCADLPFAALTVFGIFVVMLATQARLALLVLFVLGAAAAASQWIAHPLAAMEAATKTCWVDLGGRLHEIVEGIRTVKTFGRERDEERRLDAASGSLADAETVVGGVTARLEPLLELIKASGFLAIVWYGAVLVFGGSLTPGKLVAFIAYMERMSGPLQDAGLYIRHYQQAKGSLTRIVEFLASLAPPLPAGNRAVRGSVSVEARGVRVRYEGKDTNALDGVCLQAKPGEIVALLGCNGAGKSTLADVLLGLRVPDAGAVCIGGVPVSEWDPVKLREIVAAVPQDVFLFHATIADNIRYGAPDASDAAVAAAVRMASLEDLIGRLPFGIDTMVIDRGSSLSGGERQRVAIARALLRNPRLLILDEASSALDEAAFGAFAGMLQMRREECTTFIVTHNPKIVSIADRVVVLERGRVVFCGTPDQFEHRRDVDGLARRETSGVSPFRNGAAVATLSESPSWKNEYVQSSGEVS